MIRFINEIVYGNFNTRLYGAILPARRAPELRHAGKACFPYNNGYADGALHNLI